MRAVWCLAVALAAALPLTAVAAGPVVTVGSKRFTESYVLGDIAKRVLERAGIQASHRQGMGGTVILWEALRQGEISVYPEYTGTIAEEILKAPTLSGDEMRARLRAEGIVVGGDLGFNDTYALVMRQDRASQLGVTDISGLRTHPELRFGLTPEFLGRQDGWTPLSRRYGLQPRDVRGIEHALGYAALLSGALDVKDAYSTDARIAEDRLLVLVDDLHFFPQYQAVYLYRADLDPAAVKALGTVAGTIDDARMRTLNAEAERTKDYSAAAALYFGEHVTGKGSVAALAKRIAGWTWRHLQLVGISLALAVLFGVPLGIRASRMDGVGRAILGASGIIQTIPSLALLALLVPIPGFGIGPGTAIFALFLYGLLPIVRNTATGLQEIPQAVRESATALGLEPWAQLVKVYLPLASRTILAGVKTSAVINVGTATLAALIGVGGLGEPIVSGLNLNDYPTILEGALPAAGLALVVEGGFDLLDRWVIPKGLRLRG